jgi:hypothetical protein
MLMDVIVRKIPDTADPSAKAMNSPTCEGVSRMRIATTLTTALFGFTAAAALAQPPAAMNSATGARPGHQPGVGESLPLSSNASNISPADSKSVIAPTLPASSIGSNASPQDYLRSARASLVAGKTGATQQALEMAETRALDRSVPQGQTGTPDQSPLIDAIRNARHALGDHDNKRVISIIDSALSG